MASALSDETEDFVTCSVCCCDYDDNQKKPKYLDCFHTFCADCIERMRSSQISYLRCPLCRVPTYKALDQLKTNVHALHILELKKGIIDTKPVVWCLTCSSLSTSECTEKHYTIVIPSRKIRDGQDLQQKYNQCKIDLDICIQKRQEAQKELQHFIHSLKTIEEKIRKQMEQNDELLVRQLSIAEDLNKTGTSGETFEFLHHRLDQISKEAKRQLDEQEKAKKILTKINFENPAKQKIPNCAMSENAFGPPDNAHRLDSELHALTQLANSINQRRPTHVPASTSSIFHEFIPLRSNTPIFPLARLPIAARSLILTIKQNNHPLEHVQIQLSAEFVASSANVLESYKSKQMCQSEILKGSADNFLALQFPFEKLKSNPSPWTTSTACSKAQVGVYCKGSAVKGLFFLLRNANEIQVHFKRPRLLGTVTSGLATLNTLSRKNKSERLPLTVHWEIC